MGRTFTIFALFYITLYSRANSKNKPPGEAYIWRGDLTEGFLCYSFGGLIFGGAYTWRGLFSGILQYFKTLSNGLALGIEPATSSFAVKRSTDSTNPATVERMNNFYTFQRNTSVYSVSGIFLLYHFLYKWWEFVAGKIPHIS